MLEIPPVLVHYHIRKTGGSTLNSMIQHCFLDSEIAHLALGYDPKYDDLSLEVCHDLLKAYPREQLDRIRYITGHLPYVHDIFPGAKYFTVIRNPVDRVISEYYFARQEGLHMPPLRDWVLSEGPYVDNYQVRILSQAGHAQIDWGHLEVAKANIEEHFLAIAPLENMTELTLFIGMVYGWPLRGMLNEYKNKTTRFENPDRRLRGRIARINVYDLELYEWATDRFARQRLMFEPVLTRNYLAFTALNTALNAAGRILPWAARKQIAQRLFYR